MNALHAFIDDVLDLVRFRVTDLERYQYPLWLTMLVVAALGVVGGAGFGALGVNVGSAMLVVALLTWVQLSVLGKLLRVWLKVMRKPVDLSLTGILLASNGLVFLSPLTSWLPKDVAGGLALVMMFLVNAVMVNSVARVSGQSRGLVLLGIVLSYLVMSFVLAVLLVLLLSSGIKGIPPDLLQTLQHGVPPAK